MKAATTRKRWCGGSGDVKVGGGRGERNDAVGSVTPVGWRDRQPITAGRSSTIWNLQFWAHNQSVTPEKKTVGEEWRPLTNCMVSDPEIAAQEGGGGGWGWGRDT